MSVETCKTWILPYSVNNYVAIGEFELIHIIADWLRYFPLPGTPVWCNRVFLWQDRMIPLFDLDAYLDPTRKQGQQIQSNTNDIISVVAYENPAGVIDYGGFRLSALPASQVVSDAQICDYPHGKDWHTIASSCFREPVLGAIPVLDIPRIFCTRPDILREDT